MLRRRALFSNGVMAASFRSGQPKACIKPLSLQPDRGQILKPVLRLHELLHLGRQRVRVGVVHDPDQRGVVDDQRMRLRQ